LRESATQGTPTISAEITMKKPLANPASNDYDKTSATASEKPAKKRPARAGRFYHSTGKKPPDQ
jgi:hypothetical protein